MAARPLAFPWSGPSTLGMNTQGRVRREAGRYSPGGGPMAWRALCTLAVPAVRIAEEPVVCKQLAVPRRNAVTCIFGVFPLGVR